MRRERVRVLAPAKVNLYLRVAGLREDGYHEIETVMQAVSLNDELTMERSAAGSVDLVWAEGLSGELPKKPDLVERALEILKETVGGSQAAKVEIVKRIPLAGGLAGGSSDAAAAITGIRHFMRGELPDSVAREVASHLGSDVAFFLRGGTALGMGRGEVITTLESPATLWWVLGISQESLPTAEVYRKFDQIGPPNGRPIEGMVEALATGDVSRIAGFLYNDLEGPASAMFEAVPLLKQKMLDAGALGAVMTGSGPTIAGLCGGREHAEEVAEKMGDSFPRVEVVSSLTTGARIV